MICFHVPIWIFLSYIKDCIFGVQLRKQCIHKIIITSFCLDANQTKFIWSHCHAFSLFLAPDELQGLITTRLLWVARAWKEIILVTKMTNLPNFRQKDDICNRSMSTESEIESKLWYFLYSYRSRLFCNNNAEIYRLGYFMFSYQRYLNYCLYKKKVLLLTEHPWYSIHVLPKEKKVFTHI